MLEIKQNQKNIFIYFGLDHFPQKLHFRQTCFKKRATRDFLIALRYACCELNPYFRKLKVCKNDKNTKQKATLTHF